MRIEKTERMKNLLRELDQLEMALQTAMGTEFHMLEVRRDAILAKIRAGNPKSQIAA